MLGVDGCLTIWPQNMAFLKSEINIDKRLQGINSPKNTSSVKFVNAGGVKLLYGVHLIFMLNINRQNSASMLVLEVFSVSSVCSADFFFSRIMKN